jgi:hypothetical protein
MSVIGNMLNTNYSHSLRGKDLQMTCTWQTTPERGTENDLLQRAVEYLTTSQLCDTIEDYEHELWFSASICAGHVDEEIELTVAFHDPWFVVSGFLPMSFNLSRFEEIKRACDLINPLLAPTELYVMEDLDVIHLETAIHRPDLSDELAIPRAIFSTVYAAKTLLLPLLRIARGASPEAILKEIRRPDDMLAN